VGKVIGLAKGTQRDSTTPMTSRSPLAAIQNRNETLLLVLIQFLFGFSYVPSKVMVNAMPPMIWVTLRTWITALLVALAAYVLRGRPPKLVRGDWKVLLGLALVGGSANQALFLEGLRRTSTANSAVLSCMIPIFTLFFSILIGKERWSWGFWISFVCALAGALVLIDLSDFNLGRQTLQGDILVLLNGVSYGAFLAFGGGFIRRYDRLWATAFLFLVGSVYLGLVSIPTWALVDWPRLDAWIFWNGVYAVLGAVLIPYILINLVLVTVAPSRIALFVFLQPVVAGVTGWVILNDPLSWRWAVGTVLVLVGVLISNLNYFTRGNR
jgi:drug/metabolite transporter (DMT)-like permease